MRDENGGEVGSRVLLETALRAAGGRAFAYRRSAAAVWALDGVDLRLAALSEPEVAVARGHHAGRGVHRLSDIAPGDVVRHHGLRVTTPCRTLLDLGAVVGADVLERATECALRRGLVTEDRLIEGAAGRYRRGAPALRSVLGRRPPGAPPTESDAETVFVQLCRAHRLPDPVRQLPQLLGRRYRLDFAWPAARVAVEIDGASVHDRDALGPDLRRQNRVVLAGWVLLRFTWEDVVHYGDEAVGLVRTALQAGGAVR